MRLSTDPNALARAFAIRARPDFGHGKTLPERFSAFFDQLWKRFTKHLAWPKLNPHIPAIPPFAGRIVIAVFVIAIGVYVAYRVKRSWGSRPKRPVLAVDAPGLTFAQFWASAHASAARGEYRAASAQLYQALLYFCEDHALASLHLSWTADQYTQWMHREHAELETCFSLVADTSVSAMYSPSGFDRFQWSEACTAYDAFVEKVRGHM